ncbi:MAG: ABC transporter ATP-binding protein [Anaerolineae bacterium]|nr:ABC transporter ATP-binding protein [Anaerolineae bacterium]
MNGSASNGQSNGRPDGHYIATHRLNKVFQLGEQHIRPLNDVTLSIDRGQFTAIMGPSGSGKSTLLYLLGGLDKPTSGALVVAGQRIDQMSSEELAMFRQRTVGFVFQQFFLVPTMTALENVALPGIFAGIPRDERENRAARILTMLGMGDRLENRPSQLSGGQMQRVAIGRALFNNPPIIMADEPTGQLDSKTGTLVIEMLKALVVQRGKTVIFVTHEQGVAAYADRILHLKDGRVVSDERPALEKMPNEA